MLTFLRENYETTGEDVNKKGKQTGKEESIWRLNCHLLENEYSLR